jgi:hypothetical protein
MPALLNDDPLDETPLCQGCGPQIGLQEDACVVLRGMWVWNEEYDTEIFVLDPDTKFALIELPHGQYAIVTDRGGPTKHTCVECFDTAYDDEDENEDDDTIYRMLESY